VSSCNLFVVQGKTIRTPPLSGSILPGVTRDSVIALARRAGYDVREERVAVGDAMAADEVFTTGTAVVVCGVGSLTHAGERRQFGSDKGGEVGPVTLEMYRALTRLQTQQDADPFGWVVEV
jgi:branched-chain amino acid aminotransferase